jgi:hypothetical protein
MTTLSTSIPFRLGGCKPSSPLVSSFAVNFEVPTSFLSPLIPPPPPLSRSQSPPSLRIHCLRFLLPYRGQTRIPHPEIHSSRMEGLLSRRPRIVFFVFGWLLYLWRMRAPFLSHGHLCSLEYLQENFPSHAPTSAPTRLPPFFSPPTSPLLPAAGIHVICLDLRINPPLLPPPSHYGGATGFNIFPGSHPWHQHTWQRRSPGTHGFNAQFSSGVGKMVAI